MKKTTVAFLSVFSSIYPVLFFSSFWISLWWCQMLTPSELRQPVCYFQWSAVPSCLFQLLIWSLSTQLSGLSTVGHGQIPLVVGAIVSPQVAGAQRGVFCLSRMILVFGSAPDPGSCFLSSLLKASMPSLSSSISSPLCPSFEVIYCLWLSLSVVYLVTRTQQSGLSTKGQRPSWGLGYCFPSGYCCSERSGLPEHWSWSHLGDDSAPGSQWLISQFSPQGFCPQYLLKHL